MAAPSTRTRLKGIVTLRTIKDEFAGLADRDSGAPPTDRDSYLLVGAATKITITETRENNARYELKGDYTAFEPAEIVPGKVSYSVSLSRIDLYDANLLEAFGIKGVSNGGSRSNILNQLKALTLFVEQPGPMDVDGNELVFNGAPLTGRTLIIPGAWLNGFTTEYDIEDGNQMYIQNVEMLVRTVISV